MRGVLRQAWRNERKENKREKSRLFELAYGTCSTYPTLTYQQYVPLEILPRLSSSHAAISALKKHECSISRARVLSRSSSAKKRKMLQCTVPLGLRYCYIL